MLGLIQIKSDPQVLTQWYSHEHCGFCSQLSKLNLRFDDVFNTEYIWGWNLMIFEVQKQIPENADISEFQIQSVLLHKIQNRSLKSELQFTCHAEYQFVTLKSKLNS